MRIRTLLLIGLVAIAPATPAKGFEWPREAPERVGVDPGMIDDLLLRIDRGDYGRQKSLLILRHGRLVHESYFNGYRADETVPVYSVTKSWASALMGVALRRGDLESVDVPLQSLFPQYDDAFAASEFKQRLKLRHALTQRHGLAWDEWSTFFTDPVNPVNQMTRSSDWWRYVLERPATAGPGSVFRYSTGVSNLFGGVLWNATGQTALEYAQAHFFPVLDITDYHVEMSLDGRQKGTGITDFQTGMTPTGAGLWFRSRDLAKIGQLYLDRGVWQNRRVLDRKWIEESWGVYSDDSTDPEVFGPDISYGFQWWNLDLTGLEGDGPDMHFAWGYAEQFVFVIPELDLVVVTTADNGLWDGPSMISAVRDVVVPGVESDFDPVSDGGLTGSWFAPELPSQGFMLEVAPASGRVVIYWMTYEPETGEQLWLLAAGELHGRRAVLQFLRPIGGEFAGGGDAQLQEWGEVELVFTSCTSAELTFASEVAGVEGAMTLQRLTQNVYCEEHGNTD